MRFCKYCGAKVSEQDMICPACGKDITPSKKRKNSSGSAAGNIQQLQEEMPAANEAAAGSASPGSENTALRKAVTEGAAGTPVSRKRLYMLIAAAAAAVVFLAVLVTMSGRCKSSGCKNRKAPGSDYCYNHKCDAPGCRKERLYYSNFCLEHYSLYDDEAQEEENKTYSWELRISDVRVYSEYSFTYAEGTLTNNSDSTVKYVKIKGAFKSGSGNVIDTDWTYAVGGEGLAPGESCKWKMSVTKDLSIKSCDVTILEDD